MCRVTPAIDEESNGLRNTVLPMAASDPALLNAVLAVPTQYSVICELTPFIRSHLNTWGHGKNESTPLPQLISPPPSRTSARISPIPPWQQAKPPLRQRFSYPCTRSGSSTSTFNRRYSMPPPHAGEHIFEALQN